MAEDNRQNPINNTTLVNTNIYLNNAAIIKTGVASQWNFYQARNNNKNLSEFATTLLAKKEFQVLIALAASSLLSQNRWLKKAMYVVGSTGVVLGVLAAFHF